MVDSGPPSSSRHARLWIGATVVACVISALLSYRDLRHVWFTGADTFSLIERGRVGSADDLTRILSSPLMDHTQFANYFRYYRPLAELSFALDYSIWGLDPMGYHLTDVLVHAAVGVAVLFLFLALLRDRLASGIAAILFVIYPSHIEVVPAISRRQDPLGTLFFVLSLLLHVEATRRPRARRYLLAGSFTAFLLALACKETMVILPGLIALHTWWQDGDASLRTRIRDSFVAVAPYAAIAAGFFLWRMHVVGGVLVADPDGTPPATVAVSYFGQLLHHGFEPEPLSTPVFALVGVVVLAIWGLFLYALQPRLRALFAGWLLLPLAVMIATKQFSPWYLYASAAPASALLANAVVAWWRARSARPWLRTVTFVAAALVLSTLVIASPLVRSYQGWGENGEMSRQFIDQLSPVADSAPAGATIEVSNVPMRLVSEDVESCIPSTNDQYPVQSWLVLTQPAKPFTVVWNDADRLPLAEFGELHLDSKIEGTHIELKARLTAPGGR